MFWISLSMSGMCMASGRKVVHKVWLYILKIQLYDLWPALPALVVMEERGWFYIHLFDGITWFSQAQASYTTQHT